VGRKTNDSGPSTISTDEELSMNAEIERFTNDLKSNEPLRTTIKAAGTDQAEIVKAANANGYKFTVADVQTVISEGELSDTQLESVAGGKGNIFVWNGGAFISWE
jgi:predicted ribosomally synthesized peptide with nif11-like leader